jgi:hypothetical protein
MIMSCEPQFFLNGYTTDRLSKSASVGKVEEGASAPVTNAFKMHPGIDFERTSLSLQWQMNFAAVEPVVWVKWLTVAEPGKVAF